MISNSLTMLAATLLLASTGSLASGNHHGGHGDDKVSSELSMEGLSMDDMSMDGMKLDNVDSSSMSMEAMDHGAGGHMHDFWVEPPTAYSDKVFSQWSSFAIAKQGMVLYRDNCLSCHGFDGKGNGPLAKSLKHPPADLTNHFHTAPGEGDQYLFWRVSEGGLVEPFASADSAMPSFKEVLSEAERWSVLTYIHQAFHGSFSAPHTMQGDAHDGHH
ncbi:c-type cytochrome [Aestuariirhabdus litorea]|uniref:Cytochrome c n=1 Tax=Aestuariirhabdus litorea TaxID=2528527 RepID=A0A3P3VL91_9GAMM|nr:cytochrome c [Aestuariirhabdus litorea]RRJ82648.1 cytochrome c [Aestuariirhabdus litorea]RWW92809.1 c-type cytochrome [Endozoicomonadaceae bacterium GTF-13]